MDSIVSRERATKDVIENIRSKKGDASNLDFPDNSFDALLSHNVLEHIPDPKRVVQEMFRVLKPSGIIGIRDLNIGGHIFIPEDEAIKRVLPIHEADIIKADGNPRISLQAEL